MNISWLLVTHAGRKGRMRLLLTAAAVALGMFMVLVFTAGINALNTRNGHSDWRVDLYNTAISGKPVQNVAPLKTKYATAGNLNKWQNRTIYVVSLRATGDTSPRVSGLLTPKEGEYYVSQGLEKVIRDHPEARVGERFGSKQIGVIPEPLSTSPDALEVIRGMDAKEAAGQGIKDIYQFTGSHVGSVYSGIFAAVSMFGATILLFPIVLFISIATQLGSVQREKRYAALRLIGATRHQVMRIIAFESLSAACVGVTLGTAAYAAALPLLSHFRFEGMRFWHGDLAVTVFDYVLAAGLTLAFCLVANWWGMRRVHLSPLGVSRSLRPAKRPRLWRLVPLVIGLIMFVWLSLPQGARWFKNNVENGGFPIVVLLLGILAVLFGLLLAGPWLTSTIARLFARRTRRVTTLLAAKRIAVHSGQIFRSVSGVVLALFAAGFYLTAVSGITGLNSRALKNNGYSQLQNDTALISSPTLPTDFDRQLRGQPYVRSVAMAAKSDKGTVMSCAALVAYTQHHCPTGAAPEQKMVIDFEGSVVTTLPQLVTGTPVAETQYLVRLDSNDHLDQLRTLAAKTTGLDAPTFVVSGTYAHVPLLNPVVKELASLAYGGMVVTLFVAIASLVVSTISGLLERQRSFATLRLSGMTIWQMKRTVTIESLVPLTTVSLLASGIGVWIGKVFTSMLSAGANPRPTLLYFGILVGSLIIASISIRAILSILDTITQPEANQTE